MEPQLLVYAFALPSVAGKETVERLLGPSNHTSPAACRLFLFRMNSTSLTSITFTIPESFGFVQGLG